MIAALIRWSVKNRFFVVIGALALLAAGVMAVRSTPVDALPDLSDVQVIVYTPWGNALFGTAPLVGEFWLLALPLAFRSIVEYQADVGAGLIENERVHVYRGDLAEDAHLGGFDPAEVQEVRWVRTAELIDSYPDGLDTIAFQEATA